MWASPPCDFLLLLWALKNIAVPFDFDQLKYSLHFLCSVLLHAKQGGRNTERERERKGQKEWNRKMERRKIKDQQIPILLLTQLAHLLCIRVWRCLSGGTGSSAQTLWVCTQKYGAQMPPYPPLSFYGNHWAQHLLESVQYIYLPYLTSVATLWSWNLSYITTVPQRLWCGSVFDEELLCGYFRMTNHPNHCGAFEWLIEHYQWDVWLWS